MFLINAFVWTDITKLINNATVVIILAINVMVTQLTAALFVLKQMPDNSTQDHLHVNVFWDILMTGRIKAVWLVNTHALLVLIHSVVHLALPNQKGHYLSLINVFVLLELGI